MSQATEGITDPSDPLRKPCAVHLARGHFKRGHQAQVDSGQFGPQPPKHWSPVRIQHRKFGSVSRARKGLFSFSRRNSYSCVGLQRSHLHKCHCCRRRKTLGLMRRVNPFTVLSTPGTNRGWLALLLAYVLVQRHNLLCSKYNSMNARYFTFWMSQTTEGTLFHCEHTLFHF